jgi:predicted regulator of Ras-like GTPase activity (Roadblock/LC7/MglB family)
MTDYGYPTGADKLDVSWLIDQLISEVPTITYVVLVSADGLHLASAGNLDRDRAESAAALASGFLSITGQFGHVFRLGAAPENLSVRYPGGHLAFLRIDDAAGEFVAALIVAATPQTQLQGLGYAMTRFSQAVGHALTPEIRHGLHQRTLPQPAH